MEWTKMKVKVKQQLEPFVLYALDRLPPEDVKRMLTERALRQKTPQFFSEYPFEPRARWTEAQPHPAILERLETNLSLYEKTLKDFCRFIPQLKKIPLYPTNVFSDPAWVNGWIPGLDAISLYCYIASLKPKRYWETGSGQSTKFVRRAIEDFGLSTEILSLDPCPRAGIDSLCDRIVRSKLEEADLSVFQELDAGDILFVDNSHRSLTNSDVTVFFLDILPRLKPGVLVGIHDIFWPIDYPEDFANRFYSEQYLLGQLILWKENFDILLPNFFISGYPKADRMALLEPLWKELPKGIQRDGCAFWFRWNG